MINDGDLFGHCFSPYNSPIPYLGWCLYCKEELCFDLTPVAGSASLLQISGRLSLSTIDKSALLRAALNVRPNAHAPYSNFQVGAAVLADDGSVHVGANMENAAYPLGVCAEGSALAGMVAGGGSRFITACAVVAEGAEPCTPCGGCRQKLFEFGSPETLIIIGNPSGEIVMETTLGDLLPSAFGPGNLSKEDRS